MLYRLFPWDPGSRPTAPGGPLFNPRRQQGSGRHDQPALYGALYLSRSDLSPVAEWLAAFRGQRVGVDDLRRTDGRTLALVAFEDVGLNELVDLDEPAELARRDLRPSRVATHRRPVTQQLARTLFEQGLPGFGWWSTLEASWSNVTLFAERALERLTIAERPHALAVDDPVFRAAAEAVGVEIEAPRPRARQRMQA